MKRFLLTVSLLIPTHLILYGPADARSFRRRLKAMARQVGTAQPHRRLGWFLCRVVTLCLLTLNGGFGQVAFTDSVLSISENFDNFDSDGFSSTPTAGQLNSDNWRVTGLSTDETMAFGSTQTGADFTGGNSAEVWGGTTTGGVQHIDLGSGDIAFGIQPSSVDFTRGGIELRVQNNASSSITLTSIAYDVFAYNDKNRAHYFNSYYSTVGDYDYSDNNDTNRLGDYTLVSTYSSIGSSDDTLYTTSISETVSVNLNPGEYIYILWEGDTNGGGSGYDEFGIDNVMLSAQAVPEPSTYALMLGVVAMGVVVWKRRARSLGERG